MKKVLVYGFFNQGNIGDNLFVEAYRHLFPKLEFTFTEVITVDKLQDVDVVFFGGGSFLLDRPRIEDAALLILKTKNIFYIGVGVESIIHPLHLELMSQAALIATRSPNQMERLQIINSNVMLIPDLVYSLQSEVVVSPLLHKSVLFLPNMSVLPRSSDPHWKHVAWAYFKSECAQFLDWLIDNDCQLHLFPMCRADKLDDSWAMAELVAHMKNRNSQYILQSQPQSISEITKLFSQYETIITQRLHGIVLANMVGRQCFSISHHDKIKSEHSVSYYNTSKHALIEAFQQVRENNNSVLPIKYDTYEALVKEVQRLL